jgi:3-hydroxymyristoyl/3-hydroxydecanoyl-(acyl carrier protein) dehydratase
MNRLVSDFRVEPSHPALPGHFPGRPIVPGVLMLDCVLAEIQRATGRAVVRLPRVKFISVLLPDEEAHLECELDAARAVFRVTTRRGTIEVLVAEGLVLLADGAAQ